MSGWLRRLDQLAMYAVIVAVGWLVVAVLVMLALTWPGPVLGFLAGAATATVLCVRVRDSRQLTVAALQERFDAYRLADTRTDLDHVGPATGEQPKVDLYDWATEPEQIPAEFDGLRSLTYRRRP